jgi:transglutaminase-like putative cysteine protease
MIYDVRQTTTYAYASAAAYAHHVLRLTPIARERQRVTAAVLDIDPAPVRRREGRDFFDNRTTMIEMDAPHNTLTVRLAARISVEAAAPADFDASPPWESVRAQTLASLDLGPHSPVHFIYPSRMVSLDPEIRDYVQTSFPRGRPALTGAAEVMRRIRNDFTYELGATTVTTTPSMSFALRRGVCQDFAHIMIALVRRLNIPCRYVSGYMFHRDENEKDRSLEGASHAWVEAMVPRLGWVAFDPTNSLVGADRHIRVAIGRDYADVPPTRGVYKGEAQSELSVTVTVSPADKEPVEPARPSLVVRSRPVLVRSPAKRTDQEQQQQQ